MSLSAVAGVLCYLQGRSCLSNVTIRACSACDLKLLSWDAVDDLMSSDVAAAAALYMELARRTADSLQSVLGKLFPGRWTGKVSQSLTQDVKSPATPASASAVSAAGSAIQRMQSLTASSSVNVTPLNSSIDAASAQKSRRWSVESQDSVMT